MQPNEKELTELFTKLNIEESKRQEILGDIARGDEFLKQQIDPDLPRGLIERIGNDLFIDQVAVSGQGRKRLMSRYWLRIAAVIAFGIMVTALVMLDRDLIRTTPQSPVVPITSNTSDQLDLLDDEFGLWIAASTLEEELDQEMNELAISEILVLWDDAGWEIDNILGKERDDENDTILTRRRVGAFVV